MLLSLTTGLAILGAVSAHTGCGGHEIGARNLGGRVISKRQVADNVEGESRFRFSDLGREGVTRRHSHSFASHQPASISLLHQPWLSDVFGCTVETVQFRSVPRPPLRRPAFRSKSCAWH